MPDSRFPPPWAVEQIGKSDHNGCQSRSVTAKLSSFLGRIHRRIGCYSFLDVPKSKLVQFLFPLLRQRVSFAMLFIDPVA
jgi:hypothetical protein